MNSVRIIPSNQEFKSAPSVDQKIDVVLEQQSQNMVEYDRTANLSLAQVYDDERQSSVIFRPTFKISYYYDNVITGTTSFVQIKNNLYYVEPEKSVFTDIWKGYPQYFEFDFYRDDLNNTHINYKSVSAYTYNWTYYYSYAFQNNYDKNLSASLNNTRFNWVAKYGIPFVINRTTINGNPIIGFECIAPHGLTSGESVELQISGQTFIYRTESLFEVFSLGNGLLGSEEYIFNLYDIGYTGNTFSNGITGTFKRIVNSDNVIETKSKYYIRQHKILTNIEDIIVAKAGFEVNPYQDDKKLELSSITPNKLSRISQRNSSNAYTVTPKRDLVLGNLLDNQKRPVSEIYLTIINKGYSGLFNQPTNNVGLKQGWQFNITPTNNFYWSSDNVESNSNIVVSSYTQTDGVTKTFYYNTNLVSGDVIDGDFCEWNDYYQIERVISPYFQKIKYNQDVFQTVDVPNPNTAGYYYSPHLPMTIKVFSDYIEIAPTEGVEEIPNYSFYSQIDSQFRWRDLYPYGFFDDLGRGVDYPFLNTSHYPYADVIFRLIPDDEGYNLNSNLTGSSIPYKPIIDRCE